jgi:hypothetical protein
METVRFGRPKVAIPRSRPIAGRLRRRVRLDRCGPQASAGRTNAKEHRSDGRGMDQAQRSASSRGQAGLTSVDGAGNLCDAVRGLVTLNLSP